jgi:hypothetical protein
LDHFSCPMAVIVTSPISNLLSSAFFIVSPIERQSLRSPYSFSHTGIVVIDSVNLLMFDLKPELRENGSTEKRRSNPSRTRGYSRMAFAHYIGAMAPLYSILH